MRRPWIHSKRLAVAIGLIAGVIAVLAFYDAYEHRGGRPPLILRPFLPT